ncbi:hypothetical protein LOK49_LG05G00283 [Camellia lanceoleosa]|uniref:Uncharacterized protein n=1 Tax=Camellia lanceoleosa TaxID=1840588 RepID=A0ACC0HU07_9ERIC|nr:hypothetical protein LOK49_LG05G00283 [Camellia lanceoleosa]
MVHLVPRKVISNRVKEITSNVQQSSSANVRQCVNAQTQNLLIKSRTI